MDQNDKLNEELQSQQKDLQQMECKMTLNGFYDYQDDWKTLDDANANFFDYIVLFQGMQFSGGRFQLRQPTSQELRDQEEANAAKNLKKGAKIEMTDEQQKERDQLIAKEQEELQKEEEILQSLSDQDRRYRISEDKYKNPSMQWQDEKKSQQISKQGLDLLLLQERINHDKGDYIFLLRKTNISEDELAKLKKSKGSKTCTLDQMNLVVLRGWVSFEELQKEECVTFNQRVHLTQFLPSTLEKIEGSEFPTYNKDSYISLNFEISHPANPKILKRPLQSQDFIPKIKKQGEKPLDILCLEDFRDSVNTIAESLAIEYSSSFGIELNQINDQKVKFQMSNQQKQKDVQKRRDLFLYDFNVSGKYKILKEKIKKDIVKICVHKFNKSQSITGITADSQDQFYSQIYKYLVDEMRSTLKELSEKYRQSLHTDVILSQQQNLKENDQKIKRILQQSDEITRRNMAYEAEQFNEVQKAESILLSLLLSSTESSEPWQNLLQFELRNQTEKSDLKLEKYVFNALKFDPSNEELLFLCTCILIQNKKYQEAVVFIKTLQKNQPQNIILNILLSMVHERKQNKELSQQFLLLAARSQLRENQVLLPLGSHQQSPNSNELPILKSVFKDQIPFQISQDQHNQLWINVAEFFYNNKLYKLLDDVLVNKLKEFTSEQKQIYEASILCFHNKYEEAIEFFKNALENNPKNYDILLQYAQINFKMNNFDECEKNFTKLLKLKPSDGFYVLIKLGYIYINKKQYGNALAVFTKACEINDNSPTTWRGLGTYIYNINEFRIFNGIQKD